MSGIMYARITNAARKRITEDVEGWKSGHVGQRSTSALPAVRSENQTAGTGGNCCDDCSPKERTAQTHEQPELWPQLGQQKQLPVFTMGVPHW